MGGLGSVSSDHRLFNALRGYFYEDERLLWDHVYSYIHFNRGQIWEKDSH